MDKLIEYYNEYYQGKNLKEYYDYIKDMVLPEKFDSLIFLKDFCKWLVENDKIETNNLSLKAFKNIFSGGGFVEVSDLEVLLMLLSISGSPIEDLISYLK